MLVFFFVRKFAFYNTYFNMLLENKINSKCGIKP